MNILSYSDMPVLCILISAFLCMKMQRSHDGSTETTLLKRAGIICLSFMIMDIFISLAQIGYIRLPFIVAYYTNFVYLVSATALAFSWFQYSQQILSVGDEGSRSKSVTLDRKVIIIYHCICTVALLALVVTPTTGLFLINDPSLPGGFDYGPLDSIWYMLQYAPIAMTICQTFVAYNRPDKFVYREKYLPLFVFPFSMLLFGLIQSMIGTDYTVIAAGTTLGLIYLFIVNTESGVSVDELTGLQNRRQLYKEMNRLMTTDKPFYLLIMDADKFKSINDTYGHIEGDRALKSISETLTNVCLESKAKAYRFGGDEFILLRQADYITENEILDFCSNIDMKFKKFNEQENLPYVLSVSIGYTVYDPETIMPIPSVIDKADKMLYDMKKAKAAKSMFEAAI